MSVTSEEFDEKDNSFSSLLGPELIAAANIDLRTRLSAYLALPMPAVDARNIVCNAHALISSARILSYDELANACIALEQASGEGLDVMEHHAKVRHEAQIILHENPGER